MGLYEENAWVLRGLAERGNDLSGERPVDFSHLFDAEGDARAFARGAELLGYEASVRQGEDEPYSWDVTATKVMRPTCEAITASEKTLSDLAIACGGYADGWGFFNN